MKFFVFLCIFHIFIQFIVKNYTHTYTYIPYWNWRMWNTSRSVFKLWTFGFRGNAQPVCPFLFHSLNAYSNFDFERPYNKLVCFEMPSASRWHQFYDAFVSCCENILLHIEKYMYVTAKARSLVNYTFYRYTLAFNKVICKGPEYSP